MSAPWDCPCETEGCDRMATSRVIGHPEVKGCHCNAHLPKDDKGTFFALND